MRARLALACLIAAGCGFMELGELAIPSCDEAEAADQSACAALDARDGISEDACLHWQCRLDAQPGCELRPKDFDGDGEADERLCGGEHERASDCDDGDATRAASFDEDADGIDNDCNGVIDDRALDGAFDDYGEHTPELDPRPSPTELSLASSAPEPVLIAVTKRGRARLIDPVAMREVPIELASAGSSEDKHCPTPIGPKACNLRELALATVGTNAIGATVSDDAGCPRGELRIGWGALGGAQLSLWLGHENDDRPSSLEYGVDRPGDACSPLAAARPSIAAVQRGDAISALAAWLEHAPAAARGCGSASSEVAVRAIGVTGDSSLGGALVATAGGRSQELGRTRGVARPAAIAWNDGDRAHFIVGYGNASGDLELHRIDPPLGASGTLAIGTPERLARGLGTDHVALALSSPAADGGGGSLQLAAAFRTGCGPNAAVRLQRVALPSLEPLETIQLSSGEVAAGPTVVFVRRGFVQSSGEADPGGFLVSWIERDAGAQRLVATRVTEDGRRLDDPAFEVTAAAWAALVAYPTGDDRVSYVGVKQTTATIVRGTTLCTAQ